MKKKTGRDRRLIISKNLIMMLVLLVVGFVAVWSWFTVNEKVTASNINVKSAHPNELSLAKVIRYYDEHGNFVEGPDVFGGEINFSTDYMLTKDCTGDGKTLIVPDFSVIKDKEEAIKDGRKVNTNGVWEEAFSQTEARMINERNPDNQVEGRYLEFEFYTRSTNNSISLTPQSKLLSETEGSGGSLADTPSADKKSAYGNFNVDGLVGAMRVAFLAQGVGSVEQHLDNYGRIDESSSHEYGTRATYSIDNGMRTFEPELTKLWVPRPDVKLNVDPNNEGSTTNWTLNTGVSSGSSYTYMNGNNKINKFYEPASSTNQTTSFNACVFAKWKRTNNLSLTTTDINSVDIVTIKKGWGTSDSNEETLDVDNAITKKKGTAVKENTAFGDEHDASEGKFVVSEPPASGSNYSVLGKEINISQLSYSNYVPTCSIQVANFEGENNDYYVYKYKMRIWIEGTDSEARRAMDGGAFRLFLEMK